MSAIEGLAEQIAQAPDALRGWIYWLAFINSAALLFIFTRMEARWIFAAWLAGLPLLALVFDLSGFTALLALVHLSIWAPLLCWLVWRNPVDGMREPWSFYLVLVFTTNLVALGLDAAGLYRYATEGPGFA
ncbi:hypothetical protein [Parvibaculum sp.]|uniref:hypothetical protein n=1 Tax=Parvibaculum sp. TaxID=2024848 RepID=UPI00272EFA51|nr:hypothetical protein [Parvibaculum sp.]MDP1627047.1 hypothetical protein [Parvibaculum sp.]MDP2149362.1 hypothetical protein [Parvibaculum sp.]MDP3327346.1 hypothetical protein [Parvibaculum sp.]